MHYTRLYKMYESKFSKSTTIDSSQPRFWIFCKILNFSELIKESIYSNQEYVETGDWVGNISTTVAIFITFDPVRHVMLCLQNALVMQNAVDDRRRLWPNGVVPYEISNSFSEYWHRDFVIRYDGEYGAGHGHSTQYGNGANNFVLDLTYR